MPVLCCGVIVLAPSSAYGMTLKVAFSSKNCSGFSQKTDHRFQSVGSGAWGIPLICRNSRCQSPTAFFENDLQPQNRLVASPCIGQTSPK